jgi:hypothetical protein
MPALKTYDITIGDDITLRMRLTSRALAAFIAKHGVKDVAPVVSVLNAANHIDAQIALFTAALKCDPSNAIQDGAELIDILTDEGKGDSYRRELIACLADSCGLIEAGRLPDIRSAMLYNESSVMDNVIAILRREQLDDDTQAPAEATTENPT